MRGESSITGEIGSLWQGVQALPLVRLMLIAAETLLLAGTSVTGDVAQLCRLTRQRVIRGETTIETVYAITSLSADKADAVRLLELSRQHWGIENRLHYVRDVTWRADRARTNAVHAPQALAALRNAALTVLRRLGCTPLKGTNPERPEG